MQIEALKVFRDVARFRSFSQAAASNGVTQSAASQVVSQIERKLGEQLIDRSTRPLRLTGMGRRFFVGCDDIVNRYYELIRELQVAPHSERPTVHVAAIYSVGLRDMNRYIEAFALDDPHADVHISYVHPDKVYASVLQGAADLGLVSFPRRTRELNAVAWKQESMVVTCSPSHPLAGRDRIAPAALNGLRYVAFDKGLTIRREVDRFLREHGAHVEIVAEFDNIENIKKAVEADAGVALLPSPALQREVQIGTLVSIPLKGATLSRPLGIIHRPHRLSASAHRFMRILRQPLPKSAQTAEPIAALVEA